MARDSSINRREFLMAHPPSCTCGDCMDELQRTARDMVRQLNEIQFPAHPPENAVIDNAVITVEHALIRAKDRERRRALRLSQTGPASHGFDYVVVSRGMLGVGDYLWYEQARDLPRFGPRLPWSIRARGWWLRLLRRDWLWWRVVAIDPALPSITLDRELFGRLVYKNPPGPRPW